MKRRFLLSLVGAVVLSLLQVPRAIADQVYHSERLDFQLTDDGEDEDHPELRSGHVVNIHPNGPVNGALERYMINGAKPNASYQVVIEVFHDEECEDPFFPFPTALLETNGRGNAHGQAKISPAELVGLSGETLGVFWTLVDEADVVAYQTDCTVVTID